MCVQHVSSPSLSFLVLVVKVAAHHQSGDNLNFFFQVVSNKKIQET